METISFFIFYMKYIQYFIKKNKNMIALTLEKNKSNLNKNNFYICQDRL